MVQIVIQNKKGFTLIETLVAMVLFSLVLIFMLQSFLLAYRLNFEKLVKDETVKIAQEELENLRNISFSNIIPSCSNACTNYPTSSCQIQRQVRNTTVTFWEEISVNGYDANHNPVANLNDAVFKVVTIKICSKLKDTKGDKIEYTTSSVVYNKGF